jgi:hypothetical protein
MVTHKWRNTAWEETTSNNTIYAIIFIQNEIQKQKSKYKKLQSL